MPSARFWDTCKFERQHEEQGKNQYDNLPKAKLGSCRGTFGPYHFNNLGVPVGISVSHNCYLIEAK